MARLAYKPYKPSTREYLEVVCMILVIIIILIFVVYVFDSMGKELEASRKCVKACDGGAVFSHNLTGNNLTCECITTTKITISP
jgi:hypothetical protein